MTACVVYTRFSPRKGAAECESCEVQEAICRRHAESQGWEVRSVHKDEGVSGKELHKPALEEAISALQKGDVLLVYRRDRIARRVLLSEMVHHKVTRKGCRIVAVEGDAVEGDSPEAVLVRQVLAAVAEFERAVAAARTRASMLARQAKGQRMGRYAPYGFRLKDGKLVPVAKEQAAIERARELQAEGLTPYGIAKKLDEEHAKARRGKAWDVKVVKKILDR